MPLARPANGRLANQLRRAFLLTSLRLGLRQVYADVSSLRRLEGAPAIMVANHLCAWDASVAMLATDAVERKMTMAAAPFVLERWPILRRVGIFPVERGANLRTAQLLRALGKSLDASDRHALWFFAHGCHVREGIPLQPERGVLAVAKAAPRARIVPVALHYEVLEGRRPTAWVKTLPPLREEPSHVDLDATLATAGAALAADLRDGSAGYRPLLRENGHTILLRNVPCDVRRIDTALREGGLDLTFDRVVQLDGDELAALRPRLLAAVSKHAGPLYADLIDHALINPEED